MKLLMEFIYNLNMNILRTNVEYIYTKIVITFTGVESLVYGKNFALIIANEWSCSSQGQVSLVRRCSQTQINRLNKLCPQNFNYLNTSYVT
jgi:hypothetical protein